MMRAKTTLILRLGLLFLGPAAVAAQQGPDLERLRAQVTPEAYARLTTALEQAEAALVPTEPLVNKALEGVAKRVPEDRILNVVERLRENLVQARAMLEAAGVSAPAPAAIAGVASALERGAPGDAVPATIQAGRGADPTVALHTVADLMGRGLPADAAIEIVVSILQRGGEATDVLALPPALDRLRARGLSLPDAAQEILQAIRAGQGPAGLGIPPVGVPPAGPQGAAGGRPPDLPGAANPPVNPPIPW